MSASPSISAGRVRPWKMGSVCPRARAAITMASMAMPFSACIMMRAPLPAARSIAWRMSLSVE